MTKKTAVFASILIILFLTITGTAFADSRGTVEAFIFDDLNGNGTNDYEVGIPNLRIQLYQSDDLICEATSSEWGAWCYWVPEGNYTLTLKHLDWVPATPASVDIQVYGDQTTHVDFALYKLPSDMNDPLEGNWNDWEWSTDWFIPNPDPSGNPMINIGQGWDAVDQSEWVGNHTQLFCGDNQTAVLTHWLDVDPSDLLADWLTSQGYAFFSQYDINTWHLGQGPKWIQNFYVDYGKFCKATAGGVGFYDIDGDGVLDDGEPGIENLIVQFDDTSVTTSVFNWRAYWLETGEKTFNLLSSSVPNYLVPTTQISYTVNLSRGDERLDLNFGFKIDPELDCEDLAGIDIWSDTSGDPQFYPVPENRVDAGPGDDVVYRIYQGEGFELFIQCLCTYDGEHNIQTSYVLAKNWMSQELIDSALTEDWFEVWEPEWYQLGWQEGYTLLARNSNNLFCKELPTPTPTEAPTPTLTPTPKTDQDHEIFLPNICNGQEEKVKPTPTPVVIYCPTNAVEATVDGARINLPSGDDFSLEAYSYGSPVLHLNQEINISVTLEDNYNITMARLNWTGDYEDLPRGNNYQFWTGWNGNGHNGGLFPFMPFQFHLEVPSGFYDEKGDPIVCIYNRDFYVDPPDIVATKEDYVAF